MIDWIAVALYTFAVLATMALSAWIGYQLGRERGYSAGWNDHRIERETLDGRQPTRFRQAAHAKPIDRAAETSVIRPLRFYAKRNRRKRSS